MKNRAILKGIRLVVALLVFIPFVFLFIDFAGIVDINSIKWLAKIQFTPALMSAIAGVTLGLVIMAILIVTLLFGRVYCSVICPLGIMQDVMGRAANLFKSKKKRRYHYSRPSNIIRYSILALCVITLLFGSMSLISYLDPYSNFGRIAQNIISPVYIGLNNLAATVLGWFNNGSLYFMSISFQTFAFWFSFIAFVVIAVMVFMRGRLFCNTLCPVGGLLSLVSRFSIFKLQFDKEKCNKCGMCETKCKSQCIDSKQQSLDFSRCVTCYNCVKVCNKNAMNYGFAWKKSAEQKFENIEVGKAVSTDNLVAMPVKSNSRRRFLGTALATVGVVAVAFAQKQQAKTTGGKGYTKDSPIAPPGAKSIAHLMSKCTACHLCVAKCPTQVIRPAFTEYGFGGLMMPRMDYMESFCNYDCTVCSDVCPNGALQPLTIEEKKTTQIGKVYFVKRYCIVNTDGTDCGACSEHCPTKAVDMVPFRNGLRIPKINRDLCIGCGGCEYICPARPFKAIYVDGNPIHEVVQKPAEEQKKNIDLEDFGF